MRRILSPDEEARLRGLSSEDSFSAKAILVVDTMNEVCATRPYHVQVLEGRRSEREQEERWKEGRTFNPDGTIRSVNFDAVRSFAPPGMSPHNYGLAVDVALVVDRGQSYRGKDAWAWIPNEDSGWDDLEQVANVNGLETGNRWPQRKVSKLRDAAHIQHPRWKALKGGL